MKKVLSNPFLYPLIANIVLSLYSWAILFPMDLSNRILADYHYINLIVIAVLAIKFFLWYPWKQIKTIRYLLLLNAFTELLWLIAWSILMFSVLNFHVNYEEIIAIGERNDYYNMIKTMQAPRDWFLLFNQVCFFVIVVVMRLDYKNIEDENSDILDAS